MNFCDEEVFRLILILGTSYLFYKYSDCLFNKEDDIYENLTENNQLNTLKIKKTDKNAIIPTRGTKYSAGYDLYSCEEGVIEANNMGKINIGLSLIIPNNFYGRIAPRSGLTLKNKLNVGAGVVDSDYRGNISVILFNHSNENFEYKIGDRVAQLIIEKIALLDIEEINELDKTDRGENGFGSTGVSLCLEREENDKEQNELFENSSEESFEGSYKEMDNKEEDEEENENPLKKQKVEDFELMYDNLKNDFINDWDNKKYDLPNEIKDIYKNKLKTEVYTDETNWEEKYYKLLENINLNNELDNKLDNELTNEDSVNNIPTNNMIPNFISSLLQINKIMNNNLESSHNYSIDDFSDDEISDNDLDNDSLDTDNSDTDNLDNDSSSNDSSSNDNSDKN